MNPRCWAYQALFWFKQQKVAGVFFNGRQPFHILQKNITVQGTVLDKPETETDGDCTFNICLVEPGASQFKSVLHCEITPCYGDLKPVVAHLIVGTRVEVSGDFCYDPPHFGQSEHWEVHPVRSIKVL